VVRILLVEDEPNTRWVTSSLLQRAGYEAETAANGLEAAERIAADLRDGRGVPDLILLDMMMPVMGGQEFLALKASAPWAGVPVVVMTAAPEEAPPPHSVGVVMTLHKPFEAEQLLRVVRGCCAALATEGEAKGEGTAQ
jgi:CheY-like chemotaxis protein